MEGNLVRLSVEVDEPEFDKALADVVRSLAREVRVPGFRPGKVPRKVLEARMGGAAALRAEALREALPDFYAQAVVDTELDPIAQPEIDITVGRGRRRRQLRRRGAGAPARRHPRLRRPVGDPAGPGGDRRGDAAPDRPAARERRRARDGQPPRHRRRPGDHRPARQRHATGPKWWASTTISTRWAPGRSCLRSTTSCTAPRPGAILAFDAANPNDDEQLVSFRVLVKEVKVKKLPEVTDEWAAESSEFETVAELKADIEDRMSRVKLMQSQMALRQKSVEALAGLVAEDEVPEVLVDSEVNERLHDLQHRLEAQKMSLAEYFQATGTTPDELLAAVRVDADAAVKADLALRALVEAEELTLSDEELDAEVATMAERMGTTAVELRRQLDTAGRTGAVRSELRKSKALEWLLDHVALFDEEGNAMSRDDLKADASVDASLRGRNGSDTVDDVDQDGEESE